MDYGKMLGVLEHELNTLNQLKAAAQAVSSTPVVITKRITLSVEGINADIQIADDRIIVTDMDTGQSVYSGDPQVVKDAIKGSKIPDEPAQ